MKLILVITEPDDLATAEWSLSYADFFFSAHSCSKRAGALYSLLLKPSPNSWTQHIAYAVLIQLCASHILRFSTVRSSEGFVIGGMSDYLRRYERSTESL